MKKIVFCHLRYVWKKTLKYNAFLKKQSFLLPAEGARMKKKISKEEESTEILKTLGLSKICN